MSTFIRALFLMALAIPSGLMADPVPLYQPGNRVHGWHGEGASSATQDEYLDKIQPILASRCAACHGCYEGPCQLNLQSYEGLRRGFNPTPIYSAKRLKDMKPTRMIDASSVSEWREKGFFPVVGSKGAEPEDADQDPKVSLLYRLLDHGSRTHIATDREKGVAGLNVEGLKPFQKWMNDNAQQVCMTSEEQWNRHFRFKGNNEWGALPYPWFMDKYSLAAGMPFGLPAAPEQATLMSWVKDGAVGPSAEAQARLEAPENPAEIARWEAFLNAPNAKAMQTARFIYEHIFTAHVAFDATPGEFFQLVRSRTATGPIDQIATELPYDPPGVDRVYYRFRKITEAIVQKTHFVWQVNDTVLAHLKALFIDKPWAVEDHLIKPPVYVRSGHTNPNPFEYFAQIPAASRYRFMIENARIIVGAMTQGSVCVGSTATFAIRDHFWAWFLKPESDVSVLYPSLGMSDWDDFATGMLDGEDMAGHFERTVKAHRSYEKNYEMQLRLWLKSQGRDGLALSDLWTGDGDPNKPQGNPNAWLSITRHERSASVQQGAEGGLPQSIWVMSFSNFERLYYNLVASFREWGSIPHRMATWRHMSYVRVEGEDLAISFLPLAFREEVRARFARGLAMLKNRLYPQYSVEGYNTSWHLNPIYHINPWAPYDLPPRPAGTENPGKTADEAIHFLVEEVKERLAHVSSAPSASAVPAELRRFEEGMQWYMGRSQENDHVQWARQFPNISYIRVEDDAGKKWVYTILANRGYKGHNDMLLENLLREPEQDTLSFYRGFVGAYPNVFFDVPREGRERFVYEIREVFDEKSYERYQAKWGVHRNSRHFWDVFDWLHAYKSARHPGVDPVDQGIVDLSQYNLFDDQW